jgi:hypothetical protein
MEKVIVEQFNPTSGYWNKLYEVNKEDFDSSEPIKVDKYGGPYRSRTVGVPDVVEEEVEEVEESFEEPEITITKRVKRFFDDNDGDLD